jgi:hypothetical protein
MNSKETMTDLLKQSKRDITSLSQSGLDRYLKLGDVTILRALIQAIPVVGGSLDTLVFSKAEQIRRRRILHYLDSVHKYIEMIDGEKIDAAFFKTEMGLSVFEHALRTAMLESVENKRERLAAFTVNSSSKELSHRTDQIFLLQLIANMSMAHLLILLDLARKQATCITTPEERKFGRMWPTDYIDKRFFHYQDVKAIVSNRLVEQQFQISANEILDGLISFNVLAFPEEYNDEGGSTLRYDCFTVTELGGSIHKYLEFSHQGPSTK